MFVFDATEIGPQAVLPGAEKASDGQLAQLKAAAPLKPKKAQQALDFGLFGDDAKQQELF